MKKLLRFILVIAVAIGLCYSVEILVPETRNLVETICWAFLSTMALLGWFSIMPREKDAIKSRGWEMNKEDKDKLIDALVKKINSSTWVELKKALEILDAKEKEKVQ